MISSKTIIFTLLILGFSGILNTAVAQKLHVDMAPAMSEPAGKPVPCKSFCNSEKDTITLSNGLLRCRFSTANKQLRLVSLYNEFIPGEMLNKTARPALFVIEADGKRFIGSQDFQLKSISQSDNGFAATLYNAPLMMNVTLQAAIDSEGLHLSSKFTNSSQKVLDFKVAFPCINGLKISDKVEDDYYYFPWGGGVFSSRPTILRLGYGNNQALWQVMDVFSPGKGCGVYLRGDDDKGFHKNMSLRKYKAGVPEQKIAETNMFYTTEDKYKWLSSPFDQQEGISLGLEYFRRTCQTDESYSPPSAVLAVHAGNWKAAMSAYSDWAHKVWKWRPYPSKLRKVKNLGIGGWPNAPLFVNGKYRDDFLKPEMDCVELCCWWEWCDRGPGGVPFEKMLPAQLKEIEPYLVKDPAGSGKKLYMGSPTDYVKYNDRFGGLKAFRKALDSNKRKDKIITLYMNFYKVDEFCETWKKFGKEWIFVDWTGKPRRHMRLMTPCFYLPEVQDWAASTVGRVLKETGADGFRLDEVGYQYGDCLNTEHEHKHVAYQKLGLCEWNKAIGETVRKVRKEMDKVDPTAVLMTEFPGYDYIFSSLDGCLTYDLSLMDIWGDRSKPQWESVRVLEVNLQRFYFPECKVVEINLDGRDPQHKRKFWNGVACFNFVLPTAYYNIYKDNEDAYASRDCEALVPTLAKRIYANRFSANGKTLFHLYNATGKDYNGPVLKIDNAEGHHVFDMLNCSELAIEGNPSSVCLALKNDDVACLALLPDLLEVKREGNILNVSAKVKPAGQKLVVCGHDGGILLQQGLKDGENRIDLSAVDAGIIKPATVKLLDADGLLLDIAEIKGQGRTAVSSVKSVSK